MSNFNSDYIKELKIDIKEHEGLKAQMSGLRLQMESGFYVINSDLKILDSKVNKILNNTEITNGRVTALEKDTAIIRWFKNNKWASYLLLILLITLVIVFKDAFLNIIK